MTSSILEILCHLQGCDSLIHLNANLAQNLFEKTSLNTTSTLLCSLDPPSSNTPSSNTPSKISEEQSLPLKILQALSTDTNASLPITLRILFDNGHGGRIWSLTYKKQKPIVWFQISPHQFEISKSNVLRMKLLLTLTTSDLAKSHLTSKVVDLKESLVFHFLRILVTRLSLFQVSSHRTPN